MFVAGGWTFGPCVAHGVANDPGVAGGFIEREGCDVGLAGRAAGTGVAGTGVAGAAVAGATAAITASASAAVRPAVAVAAVGAAVATDVIAVVGSWAAVAAVGAARAVTATRAVSAVPCCPAGSATAESRHGGRAARCIRLCVGQHPFNGPEHKLVDLPAVPEPHFQF